MTAATKRLRNGMYQMVRNGKTFHIENIQKQSDSDSAPGWLIYEVMEDGEREYLNDFASKRDAVKSIKKWF